VTNILLNAFDKLREMVNHATESAEADIADILVNLTGLASSYLPSEEKASLYRQVTLDFPMGLGKVTIPQTDLDRARRIGQHIYWIDLDLIHDIEKKNQTILSFFNDLSGVGEILDSAIDFEEVGTLDGTIGNRLPLRLLFATVLESDRVCALFKAIEPGRIHLWVDSSFGERSPSVPISRSRVLEAPAETPAPPKPSPSPRDAPPAKSGAFSSQKATLPQSPDGSALLSQPLRTEIEDTLRVRVGLLEALMNLAGELVLSRNQLRIAVDQNNKTQLDSVNQRVNQVTTELQDVIMQTRLQTIDNVFSKFPRVVRDLSRSLGKEIEIDIRGKDVAMDKTLIEGLSDPLMHMVRNAVDHGIESPAERIKAGKKTVGKIWINARYEAGQVLVEIIDDGKGIDGEKVANVAVSRGLMTREKILGLSDRDKQSLIFLPGLSTSEQVSNVSGRGVGMDVVKSNLDRLGGQIEIHSEVGKGSAFRIKLPLTLAIIPSLIVSVERERFAIPQANIEELHRIRPQEIKNRIEIVGDSEVLLLRDRILPLARLSDILGAMPTYLDPVTGRFEADRRSKLADRRSKRYALDESSRDIENASSLSTLSNRSEDRRKRSSSALEIAVVTTGTLSYALVVDAFYDTEEIVVKPLGSRFKKLREYSGATILGDGAVALILDMAGLATKARLTSLDASGRGEEVKAEAETQQLRDSQSLLLFENGPGEQCAVSLNLVQRIERLSPKQLERYGGNRTMKYRGGSLPLIALSDVAAVSKVEEREDLVVLVSHARGRDVGLLGAMPVDTVETSAFVDQQTHRQKGILGSAIIQDTTTLIADLYGLVDAAHPDWVNDADFPVSSPTGQKTENATVLLAEDSDFFRGQMKKYLEEGGFYVIDAPDGEAAWELLLENVNKIRAVVTDIEMPRLNGLGLTQRIRNDERTLHLPVVAITSLAGDENVEKGMEAGIDDYQVKLDRDKLLESVQAMIESRRGRSETKKKNANDRTTLGR